MLPPVMIPSTKANHAAIFIILFPHSVAQAENISDIRLLTP